MNKKFKFIVLAAVVLLGVGIFLNQAEAINYNNSFEADAVGTSYSNITDWFTQKVRTGFTIGFSWDPDGVIYQADLQVVTDRKYSGNKSLKSWVKNYETGGARYTSNLIKNIEGNRFKLNGDSFSVWVSDMSYTTSSRYAHGFWIRVLDIDNVYTELLRCISWRADEGCGGAFYNNYDQSATGADGQTWYRYTVNVPSGMNKDRLEVEFLHEASSWDGTIAESTIYIDWFDSNLELIQLSQHTITYNANGGTCSPTSRMIYDGLTALAPSCSRTGYTLSGFTRTSGSGGTLNTSTGEVTNVTGSQTIRADWTANTYTVTFDRRSGSGGSSSVTATYGLAMPSATAPTRTGYTFNGYFDATSGGTQYYTSAMASARTWNKTSNTTLYAQWTANTYTVTLNRNGGSGGSSSVTATYGSNMPGITVPTRQYFNFLGYWDATSGGTQYYSSSGTSSRTWNKTSNTTLYARWQDVCGNLTQITDSRDNKVYGIIAISGKCWTTKNAGYTEGGNNFRPAGGDDNNINTFGVLYKQWQAVNSACPSGWRMALSTDYSTLSTSDLDGSWNHKNAGYGEQYLDWTTIKHRYFDFNSYGYYWNSTRTGVSDAAYQRRCIGCAWNTGTMNNDRLLSVRCIKN